MDLSDRFPVVSAKEWRTRKKEKKKSPLNMVFVARTYVIAFDRCRRQEPISPATFAMPIFPALVCGALGIELAIKAVLAHREISVPLTHNLLDLYRRLPITDQDAICSAMQLHQIAVQMLLHPIQHGFEDWRYVYEKDMPSLDINFVGKLLKASVQVATEATKEPAAS